MKQTKSATPYVVLLLAIVMAVPYANHQAQASQQIAVEVASKVTYIPKAQAAHLPSVKKKEERP
ncbi:MAG: hypothetical protein AAFN81_09250 [Bacteroidota bacterium]